MILVVKISIPQSSVASLRQDAATLAPSSARIRRREFLLGATASAATLATMATLLGSSVLIARNNARAEAERDAAIRQLKSISDQEIATANAEKLYAMRKAEADKFIAIQEVNEQKADNGIYTNTDTIGFSELKREIPWLEALRKTVAFLRIDDYFGSSVLLDKQGTITLCAHEYPSSNRAKFRLFFNTKMNGQTIEVIPYNFMHDKTHDLMFATVDPAIIRKFSLRPVRWGRMGYENIGKILQRR